MVGNPFLCLLSVVLIVDARTGRERNPQQQNYNPCCSMPCLHRGKCIPISNVLYECDCIKGYFGRSCEKATLNQWVSDQFRVGLSTKQKFALTGKLIWAVVNNIPVLHDTVLRYVYLSGIDLGCFESQILNFAGEYTTLDAYYNLSFPLRGLPPVPDECPTPLGIKGPKKLPNVDEVFELLFRRRQFKPCPHGTNLMLATFAQHLSHQFYDGSHSFESHQRKLVGNDVSHIYGSDEVTRRALRRMVGGKLKVRIINGEEFPPYLEDAPGVEMIYPETDSDGKYTYPKWAMGHKLLSTSPLTFALATIWLREHNRLCDIMLKEHPDWDDERIYQTVQWIVLGELLTITAGEYFQHLAQYRLKFAYKPQLFQDNAVPMYGKMQYEMSFIFQLHQMMPDAIKVQGKLHNLSSHMFGNNRLVFEVGLDAIVDAMSRNPTGQVTHCNSGEATKNGIKSLIEEGRKLRLRSFNDYRRFFDLKPYESFEEMVADKKIAEELKALYGDVDAVEFAVGIFVERHIGSVLPPTVMFLAGPMALKGIAGNPLGSSALWRPSTFGGKVGFDIVQKATLQKLFCQNLKGNCKNNVWVSFRTPHDVTSASRRKILALQ